jgi:hypothetical protein
MKQGLLATEAGISLTSFERALVLWRLLVSEQHLTFQERQEFQRSVSLMAIFVL